MRDRFTAVHRLQKSLLLLLVIALSYWADGAGPLPSAAASISDRFGVISHSTNETVVRHVLQQLGIQWWYAFADNAGTPAGTQRVLLLRTSSSAPPKSADQLRAWVQRQPGAYWLIGNEPNVPGQDDVTPVRYAELFHYYATTLKSIDPAAKLVGPNILNWSHTCTGCPGFTSGKNWTTQFIEIYQGLYGATPPVDVWGIHAYTISWDKTPMTNADIGIETVTEFRNFLQGLQSEAGKPIWVTEFGVIWGYESWTLADGKIAPVGAFRSDRVQEYLERFVGWLNENAEAKHIDRWFYYISHGAPEPYATVFAGASLLTGRGVDAELSQFGQTYHRLATQPVASPPAGTSASATVTAAEGGSATIAGATVTVPAGALTTGGNATLTVAVAAAPPASVGSSAASGGTAPPAGILLGATRFTITVQDHHGREVEQLARPLELAVRYRDEDLHFAEEDIQRLHLRRLSKSDEAWVDVGGIADPGTRTVTGQTDRLGLFAMAVHLAAPALTGPAAGRTVGELGPVLTWHQAGNTAQFQVQVIPYNNDGPGINLIIGAPELVAASRYQINTPVLGQGNYIMLPDMGYTWRVRTSPASTPLADNDSGWSNWSAGSFRTPAPPNTTVRTAGPSDGSTVSSLTPVVRWSDGNTSTFYYEVQLSKDPEFVTEPARATAAVYWNLVHGGQTDPLNSYTVPQSAPLEPEITYYWRVRPRVQGDGQELPWSATWRFQTPAGPSS